MFVYEYGRASIRTSKEEHGTTLFELKEKDERKERYYTFFTEMASRFINKEMPDV